MDKEIRYILSAFHLALGATLILMLETEFIIIDAPNPAIFYGIAIYLILMGILIFYSEKIYKIIKKSDDPKAD